MKGEGGSSNRAAEREKPYKLLQQVRIITSLLLLLLSSIRHGAHLIRIFFKVRSCMLFRQSQCSNRFVA